MNAPATVLESEHMPRSEPRPARILVLEPDPQVRTWLVAELGLVGHEILQAETAEGAFLAWIGSREPLDLLVMNPLTARSEGLILWSRLAFLQPKLRVVLPIIPDLNDDDFESQAAGAELASEVACMLNSPAGFSSRAT